MQKMETMNLPITPVLAGPIAKLLQSMKVAAQEDRLRLLEEGNHREAAEALEVYLDAQVALEALPETAAANPLNEEE